MYDRTDYEFVGSILLGKEDILDTNTTTDKNEYVLGYEDDKTIKFFNVN